jgi:hypothetical protein
MTVFEYDTLNLPGTAALDPEKTLKDIGVTLTKEDIIEAGGQVVSDADDDTNGSTDTDSDSDTDTDTDNDTTEGGGN